MRLDVSTLSIDRQSPVPLYFQIERLIAQEIFSGISVAGDQLPAEPEIAEHFGVSRSVVRQALMRLGQEGLVERVRGHGTYVANRQYRTCFLEGAEGFFFQEGGVVSKVLRTGVEPMPSWASDALSLPRKTSGVVLERLRYVDGLLTVYDLNYLPERFADAVIPLKDEPMGSLYDVLGRTYNLSVAYGVRKLDAVIAGERFARILETKATAPLVLIEAVDFGLDSEPFDCYRTWVRPDRVHLEVRVVPAPTLGYQEPEGGARYVAPGTG